MKYTIKNPSDDMNGNAKENIFIAYDENGHPIGHAYTYPAINHYQTYKTPYMIYFEVMVDIATEAICKHQLNDALYDRVFERAKVLRKQHKDLAACFYTGFMKDLDQLDAFKEKGFHEDCTIIMSLDMSSFEMKAYKSLSCRTVDIQNPVVYDRYEKCYNQLFITPLNRDLLSDLSKMNGFACMNIYKDEDLVGGYTTYTDEGIGYIETLFVCPDYIGKGYGKVVLEHGLNYLKSQKVTRTELEVRRSNERAVNLYQQYGFKEVTVNIMFPNLTL